MSKADRFRRLADNKTVDEATTNKSDIINKIVGADSESTDLELTSNTDTYQSTPSVLLNNETEQSYEIVKRNTNTEYVSDSDNSHSDNEYVSVQDMPKTPKTTRVPKAIEEFEKRLRRPTVEETHTRQTWLINNELLRRLNKLARNQGRGFKTHLINYALERVLEELEGK